MFKAVSCLNFQSVKLQCCHFEKSVQLRRLFRILTYITTLLADNKALSEGLRKENLKGSNF